MPRLFYHAVQTDRPGAPRPQRLMAGHVVKCAQQRARKSALVEGDQESGWLTVLAPGARAGRSVTFDITLVPDGDGVLLSYAAQDGSLVGDTWHRSEAEAKQVAEHDFGVLAPDWRHE